MKKNFSSPDEESELFESPVMAGGLFAINANFFWQLGGYDPELRIWGGEQYELSFKIWQCGGKILDAPCSRIGHVYRKFSHYKMPQGDNFMTEVRIDFQTVLFSNINFFL